MEGGHLFRPEDRKVLGPRGPAALAKMCPQWTAQELERRREDTGRVRGTANAGVECGTASSGQL